MTHTRARQITQLLQNAEPGNAVADDLLPLVYAELRALAKSRVARERPGQTLQATALVHEAYLRLLGGDGTFENRRHFFAAAAEAMRRILVEQARRKARVRHGGELRRTQTPVEQVGAGGSEPAADLLDLDEALTRLEARDKTMAGVVKLRYFAGMKVDETAEALGISPRAVNRHWTAARAWLGRELGQAGADGMHG